MFSLRPPGLVGSQVDSNFSFSHFVIRRKKVTVVSFIVVVVVNTFTRQGSEKFAGFKTKSIKHLAL